MVRVESGCRDVIGADRLLSHCQLILVLIHRMLSYLGLYRKRTERASEGPLRFQQRMWLERRTRFSVHWIRRLVIVGNKTCVLRAVRGRFHDWLIFSLILRLLCSLLLLTFQLRFNAETSVSR